MKKVLVIGSTVVDIIIRLNMLPTTGVDINLKWQKMSLGGCAFNVSQAIAYFDVPYLLFSPIGSGIYADYVAKALNNLNVPRAELNPEEPNGCCYCLVEDGGERSFICEHGAEYRFKKEWFDALNPEDFDCAYICGLEIEEYTGDIIIDFLKKSKMTVYFAPGPRINAIGMDKLERIFNLHPILHVNKTEAISFTNTDNIRSAAKALMNITKNTVVITDGENGSCCLSGGDMIWYEVPAFKAEVVDTIGAGDAHIGTFIAQRKLGKKIDEALTEANKISSMVVQREGARLEK
ncbi:Bifunctional ribokinase/ribose-5-phosphate isomerase A [bioreactor metagenome]|uniref:Bifunctional ribokinase/ribose-5-phosphate isomerase A n=1 Tax=bioreactor metagenome TaxID=1076179 RepID=A0A645BJD2_9ZZZZ|nr:PfkB family carbohydrate kinase [Candidatus Metalachnospira sp.]